MKSFNPHLDKNSRGYAPVGIWRRTMPLDVTCSWQRCIAARDSAGRIQAMIQQRRLNVLHASQLRRLPWAELLGRWIACAGAWNCFTSTTTHTHTHTHTHGHGQRQREADAILKTVHLYSLVKMISISICIAQLCDFTFSLFSSYSFICYKVYRYLTVVYIFCPRIFYFSFTRTTSFSFTSDNY